MSWQRIGTWLLSKGLISEAQLAQVLGKQRMSGGRFGDIAVASGMLSHHALYQALAEQEKLPFADLLRDPPDKALLDMAQVPAYLQLGLIPWRRHEGYTEVAVCSRSEEVMAWIGAHYGERGRVVMTSPVDIRRSVEHHFGGALEELSRGYLWKRYPQFSAYHTLANWQKCGLVLGVALAAFMLVFFPALALMGILLLLNLIYFATMLFKALVFALGMRAPVISYGWSKRLASLSEESLPVYTVLVPMFREVESLPGLLESLHLLDYPVNKLDIKLLIEQDDEQTLQAAKALRPCYKFEIIVVPFGIPRTKPRACNYALHFARGEYVAVYDADDRPERTQLKKAVYSFRNQPKDVVCLQARLAYYNSSDNLLTRFFALEYHALFYVLLQGLGRLGIPIPLGGTSNHIALSHIRELGGWDPYNVTEDADLGVRISVQGYRTAMLDSYTLEEAPNTAMAWIRQRSRWIKGYMQTWLVYMRSPARLYRVLEARAFAGFQCFVGLPGFAFLSAPLLWGITLLWVMQLPPFERIGFPDFLLWISVANLAIGLAIHWVGAYYSASYYKRRISGVSWAAFCYPLYLVLHSLASYKALWQLLVKPHFWEKTMHGRAKTCTNPLSEGEDAY